jgi:hypothetical protein
VLIETGYWPPQIPFDMEELATVVSVINQQRKEERNRGRKR